MTNVEWVGLVALAAILLGALGAFVSKCIDYGMHGRQISDLTDRLKRLEEEFLIFEEADDATFMAEMAEHSAAMDRRIAELKAMGAVVPMPQPPTPKRWRH